MIDWIALNMTPGVGPRAATKLLERFGSAGGVFHARRTELESLRLRPETIESIIKREFQEKAAVELGQVKQIGGDVLILDDGSYPAPLREIDDPPPVLYVKGDWQACFEQPCVGVIGSRKCSTYGENASEMLSRDLASRGICIVSGLARGIDAAAHRGAMSGKGRTIAVLGTGIDGVYPKDHHHLVREILGKRRSPDLTVSAGHTSAKGQLPVSQSNHKRAEFRGFDRRGVRTQRFFDHGEACHGTEPRSNGGTGKHNLRKLIWNQLPYKERG